MSVQITYVYPISYTRVWSWMISNFKIQWILHIAYHVLGVSAKTPWLADVPRSQSEREKGKSWFMLHTSLHPQEAPRTLRKNQSVCSHHCDRSVTGLKSSFQGQDFISRLYLTHFWQHVESKTCLLTLPLPFKIYEFCSLLRKKSCWRFPEGDILSRIGMQMATSKGVEKIFNVHHQGT